MDVKLDFALAGGVGVALVVLLRGVNVGGHKTFRPSLLAKELSDYDAVNIGAAGTFVIRKPIPKSKLRSELLRRLPFEAEVIICEGHDLVSVASGDPFAGEPSDPDVVRFVSILSGRHRGLPSIPVNFPAEGEWVLRIIGSQERFVFGVYRRQMRAISYLTQIEKLFGMPLTTRNWNTITAIASILKSEEPRQRKQGPKC